MVGQGQHSAQRFETERSGVDPRSQAVSAKGRAAVRCGCIGASRVADDESGCDADGASARIMLLEPDDRQAGLPSGSQACVSEVEM